MIRLSNGHCLESAAASGSLAFDGRGWSWEWPLRWARLLDPNLFTIVVKTLLLESWPGNLRRYAPWRVVKFLSEEGKTINPLLALAVPKLAEGAVNAVGLTNDGFDRWLQKDLPIIQRHNYQVIVSITGPAGKGCVEMAERLNDLKNVVGVEFNASCPNTDPTLLKSSEVVVGICQEIKKVTEHPLLVKLSYIQPYLEIARELKGTAEAISINSVPWNIVFPDKESPLARYGGGGVSGRLVQRFTWQMVSDLSKDGSIPVIGASIWEYEDIRRLQKLGASAFHFGTIFFWPWKPSSYVRKRRKETLINA